MGCDDIKMGAEAGGTFMIVAGGGIAIAAALAGFGLEMSLAARVTTLGVSGVSALIARAGAKAF